MKMLTITDRAERSFYPFDHDLSAPLGDGGVPQNRLRRPRVPPSNRVSAFLPDFNGRVRSNDRRCAHLAAPVKMLTQSRVQSDEKRGCDRGR